MKTQQELYQELIDNLQNCLDDKCYPKLSEYGTQAAIKQMEYYQSIINQYEAPQKHRPRAIRH